MFRSKRKLKKIKTPTITPTSSAEDAWGITQAPSGDGTDGLTEQFGRMFGRAPTSKNDSISNKLNDIYASFTNLDVKDEGKVSELLTKTTKIIFDNSFEELMSLGVGELTRIVKVMNKCLDSRNIHDDLNELLELEDKIQSVFIRAFHLRYESVENYLIDRIIVYANEKSVTLPKEIITMEEKNLLVSTIENDLSVIKGLGREELNFLSCVLADNSQNKDVSSFNGSLKTTAEDFDVNKKMEFRNPGIINNFLFPEEDVISHKTTLLAIVNNYTEYKLSGYPITNGSINNFFLKSVLNHTNENFIINGVVSLIKNNNYEELPFDILIEMEKSLTVLINKFKPSSNLGHQMDSPLAIRFENLFAAKCIERPPLEMIQTAKKIFAQFESVENEGTVGAYMSDYLRDMPDTYKVCIKRENVGELRNDLKSGKDIALAIDFHHFYCKKIAKDLIEKGSGRWPEITKKILRTQNYATYENDIFSYRGNQVPLPRLNVAETVPGLMGVGNNMRDGIRTDTRFEVKRHSRIKKAFGQHAKESSVADVAQACGTTGRGNMHLWSFALRNHDSKDKLNKKDAATFLLMLATVMTADGGHTLSETLATANIASKNAKSLLFGDKITAHETKYVRAFHNDGKDFKKWADDKFPGLYKKLLSNESGKLIRHLFGHFWEITKDMKSGVKEDEDLDFPQNFNFYDMIFSEIDVNSPDDAADSTMNFSMISWNETRKNAPDFRKFLDNV